MIDVNHALRDLQQVADLVRYLHGQVDYLQRQESFLLSELTRVKKQLKNDD